MPHQSATRERVLAAIRTATAARTIADLSDELALHANTVRFHLQALREAGLIVEETRATGGRGRPRVAYRASTAGARSGERNYQMLADILISDLIENAAQPRVAARQAGRTWGQRLVRERNDQRGQAAVALDVLTEMGFEPEPRPKRRPRELLLHNCPFRELVDEHQAEVCALHSGVVEALVSTGGRSDAALLPFVTPTTCAVRLAAE